MLGGSLVTLGLPALEIFLNEHGTAYAEDGPSGAFPRRFGLFFWGNGMLPPRWNPEQDGDTWELSEQLQPLASVKDYVSVVTGTRVGIPNTKPHLSGAAGILTGVPLVNPYDNFTFGGASVDQIIAAKTGELTRFPSIEFGAEPGDGLSYNGPNSKNPPETSPLALFERIFGGSFQLPGEGPIVDPTLALRRSILDAVLEDVKRLQLEVGAQDKVRLEQHLEGIRGLEKRLARMQEDPPNMEACAYPTQPEAEYPEIEGRPQLHEKNKVMSDIIAMALACDQTRVFSNFFTYPVSNHLFPEATAGHHQLTHDEPGDQPEVNKITIHCVQALAYQIEALKNIQEGSATLLDSCMVLGTSDTSEGKVHSTDDYPLVLAGGCGGKIKTNYHYRSLGAENSSKVMLSICRAMGLDLPSYGAEGGYTTDGLSEIEV